MKLIEMMMQTRSDVELRLRRTAGMRFYHNGRDVTDDVRGMNVKYIAELDRLIAERRSAPHLPSILVSSSGHLPAIGLPRG